jgi:hypothetical protein
MNQIILVFGCAKIVTPASIVRILPGGIRMAEVIVYGLPARFKTTFDDIGPPIVPFADMKGI